ncbi:hypothetical protein [Cronobacter phage vB_Cdu_VP8]|nr:hypothetical protein [Cronobacter phage vB_Cdu_VP8]
MEFKITTVSTSRNGVSGKALAFETRDGKKHNTEQVSHAINQDITHIFNDYDVEYGNIVKLKVPKTKPAILTDAHAEERSFLQQQIIALRTTLEKPKKDCQNCHKCDRISSWVLTEPIYEFYQ